MSHKKVCVAPLHMYPVLQIFSVIIHMFHWHRTLTTKRVSLCPTLYGHYWFVVPPSQQHPWECSQRNEALSVYPSFPLYFKSSFPLLIHVMQFQNYD